MIQSRLVRGATAMLLIAVSSMLVSPDAEAQSGGNQGILDGVNLETDIPYAGTGNPRQRLNLLLPKSRMNDQPLPVIVYIHGGAWLGGDRIAGHRRLASYVSDGQYAGVSVGYRLTREATWPAQIHDCKAAIRWIRGNADKYNIDPNRIGVIGDSAGGHLVAMLGTSGGIEDVEGDLGAHRDLSSRVQCVVDLYGPSDISAMNDFPSRLNHDAANSPEGMLVGGRVSDNKEVAKAASPISYVSDDDPPFLIIHGNEDMVVPYNQSERLSEALKKATVECYFVTVDGAGHGGFRNPAIQKNQRQFFDKHLRGVKNTIFEGIIPNRDVPRIPLVYDVEHTGSEFPDPVLPAIDELPVIRPLPDPFEWSSGSGRSTEFKDWSRRRSEIKAEIEHYGIGKKPSRPQNIDASFEEGTLVVQVTENGATLELTAKVQLPDGDGPFPAVIGIGFGGGSGSLPPDIFVDRRIATIAFNFSQVMAHTQKRGQEPINGLYPDLTYIGAYSGWSWGISRIIDGLEIVADELPIDRKRLAVTGCSFAGKMALFAGALDERIALTIAQESGGGGAAAWRVSQTLGNVETLGKTSRAWFIEDMFAFSNSVEKLPYDHHELMAMVAPRALLVLGNPDFEWLADESGYVSCRAAHEVWKTFGIADRFGFSIVGGHPHCRLPDSQRPEVEAFVDKFLLGKIDANTTVTKHPFENVQHRMWYDGWTTGKSTFPMPDVTNVESIYFEAESSSRGSQWNVVSDPEASGGRYLTIRSGLNSPESVPHGDDGKLTIPFTTSRDTTYYLFARVHCPSPDDDSFWVKVDDGEFVQANGLGTSGWQWVKLISMSLTPEEHVLSIAYREDGALLDQICFTTYPFGPMGLEAANADKVSQPNATAHAAWPRDDANSRKAHSQLLAKTKQGTIDVYFQGDSITRRWGATDYPDLLAHWQKTFHGWNAANFAWGGDNTHHILWRMRNGELDGVSPKVVVLQAGTNNLPWSGPADDSHVQDVVTGIGAIIDEFRKRTPDATIVLTALFPRTQNNALAPAIEKINSRLDKLADRENIRFLNINDKLTDATGKLLPQVSSDGLHLDEPGYQIWADALKPVLTEILGPPAENDHAPPATGDPSVSERDVQ